ncbi:hypothetical protein GF391_00135 [Candidatus Uhrbacteria bacterium]|nr:hypothetical protein [Candidatus Uhrbacteria bacterium]
MREEQTGMIESIPPLSSEALPDTIRPKENIRKLLIVFWWIGFSAYVAAVICCFAIVIPFYFQDGLLVGALAVMLATALGSLFVLCKMMINHCL